MLKIFQVMGVALWLISGIVIALIGSWFAEGPFIAMPGVWLIEATKCPFLQLAGLGIAAILMGLGHVLAMIPLLLLMEWINPGATAACVEEDEF